MSTVFLSYRRETAAGEARALSKSLVARLGKGSVFMDVDSVALGRDFRSVLQETLGSCDLMLVVIDKNWAEVKDAEGRTRLRNPDDLVRIEVEAALKRDIAFPVLVGGAGIPAVEQLPEEIGNLAYRNAFELSHNKWESDVREMIRQLGLVPKRRRIWVLVSALIVAAAASVVPLLNHYGWHLTFPVKQTGDLPPLLQNGVEETDQTRKTILNKIISSGGATLEDPQALLQVPSIKAALRPGDGIRQVANNAEYMMVRSQIISMARAGKLIQ